MSGGLWYGPGFVLNLRAPSRGSYQVRASRLPGGGDGVAPSGPENGERAGRDLEQSPPVQCSRHSCSEASPRDASLTVAGEEPRCAAAETALRWSVTAGCTSPQSIQIRSMAGTTSLVGGNTFGRDPIFSAAAINIDGFGIRVVFDLPALMLSRNFRHLLSRGYPKLVQGDSDVCC